MGLKIATFNVWHGLAGRGVVNFREFETASVREERFKSGLECLQQLDPDIVLFQELNPVSAQGREISQVLGGTFQGRVDQSGLKFFSRGFPKNLATGLGVLLRNRVQPSEAGENASMGFSAVPPFVRVSGSVGFSGESLSFHLDEQRYAQFSSIQHESLGRLLIINTHLHHGFERFPELMRLLHEAVVDGRVARIDFDRLMPALDHARDRRLAEVDRIFEIVHGLQGAYDGILLGGDLNSTPEGAAYRSILGEGYVDLAEGKPEPTWDPVKNRKNHQIQASLGFDFPLPDFGNRALVDVYRAFDAKPRRIDFLFGKGSLSKSAAVERFGFPDSSDIQAPSDHFGLMATFK